MSEENSSSLEVTHNIPFHVQKYKTRMLIVPFGYPFNFDFMTKAGAGDVISLANGSLVRILHKTTVNVSSPVADILAYSLYGKPMKDLFLDFIEEFGAENIQNEEVVVFTYEPVE